MILSVFPVRIFTWWLLLLMLSCNSNCFMIVKAEVCTLEQFETGEWEYMPEKTQKDYICCSDLTVNMSNEVKDACRKQNVYFPSYLCNCDFRANTILTISERAKWRWVPDADCELLDINPQRFCDLLGDRTIGFYGDSTMEQTMYSLKGYLHATSCVDSIFPKLHYEAPQLGVNNLLRKQLEKFSSPASKSSDRGRSNNQNKKIDILLMNFGTQYQNMSMFQEGMQLLQDDINYLQSLSRDDPNSSHHNISYLWRLNIVPHRHCEDYQYPFTDLFTESQRTDLGWNVFQSYDLYAREMMDTLQIPILEVTEAFTMRPDAHVVGNANIWDDDDNSEEIFDCVHSCLSGNGMDVQIQMMAHYLYYHSGMKE